MIDLISLKKIRERYKRNPEPVEIQQTRDLLTNAFSKIEFVEDVHKYFIPDGKGNKIELPSVSKTIEQWVPYTDWDERAEWKAVQLGKTKEEIQRMWHENNIISTNCGSKTHFFGENMMNMFIGKEELTKKNLPFQYTDDDYIIPYNGKEIAITNYYLDILKNDDVYPVMPEVMGCANLTDKCTVKQPYAGTMDILLAYRVNGEIVYAIHDYKTNKDLYNSYTRDNHMMMLPPFDDMYEEAFSHYTIQLSMYQIMLMQLGIKVVDRVLIWLKDDGTYVKARLKDLTKELLTILNQ